MKKLLALLLALCLICSAACALEVGAVIDNPDGLSLSIDGAYSADVLDDETSLTHSWIIVDVTATNYSLESISISNRLSAKLVYGGKYAFDAETDFAVDIFEPLVRLGGRLIFRVPKLVLEADADALDVQLYADGQSYPLDLSWKQARHSASALPDYYFKSPEDAVIYFAQCMQSGDFTGALGAFYNQPAAENYDLEGMIGRIRSYTASLAMPLPGYEAYTSLNMLKSLPVFQLSCFITSLLSDVVPGKNIVVDNDALILPAEEEGGKSSPLPVSEWIYQMNPDRLASLQLRRIYRYEGANRMGHSYLVNGFRQGAIYGYNDSRDYLAVYSLDGQEYAHSYTIVHYPRGWKISAMNSVIMNFDSYGTAVAIEDGDPDDENLLLTWNEGKGIEDRYLPDMNCDMDTLCGTWAGEFDGYSYVFEIRDDMSFAFHENGSLYEGSWMANAACIAMIEDIRNMEVYSYSLNDERLVLHEPGNEEDYQDALILYRQ